MDAWRGDHPGVGAAGDGVFTGAVVPVGRRPGRGARRVRNRGGAALNTPHDDVNGDRSPGTEVEPKVYDAELVDGAPSPVYARPRLGRFTAWWLKSQQAVDGLVRAAWRSGPLVRARSVAGYRVRK